jgi:putative peptide zinc metalloprotease protein
MDSAIRTAGAADAARIFPARQEQLVIRPVGEDGRQIVKNPVSGEYFRLGPQEAFLLSLLDGRRTAGEICAAFEQRFGQPLLPAEVGQFVTLAGGQSLLALDERSASRSASGQTDDLAVNRPGAENDERGSRGSAQRRAATGSTHRLSPQSLLYWRRALWDPDRTFTWLAPRLWFIWTRGFLVLSLAAIAIAALVLWTHSHLWLAQLPEAMRWETLAVAWVTVLVAALCHECAHGLTCKRFGGEVHEIGFLLVLLMPGLYCNVSDAWLFPEKWKRLLVTFAGAYCDLVLWAMAVFVWRLTLGETLVNYLAYVVLSVAAVRALFNFVPLLKLDGYYLLSDALEIPNLRERAMARLRTTAQWLLWGGPRPRPDPRGELLLAFGLASWLFSLLFLGGVIWGFLGPLRTYLGSSGVVGGLLLGGWMMLGLVHGFSGGQATQMVHTRRGRTLAWLGLAAAGAAALLLIKIEDRYGGEFQLYPIARAEIRAPVAGFIANVTADQGTTVSPGQELVRVEVPDLACRLAQKRAEMAEAEAALAQLKAGTRPEELAELEARVEHSRIWRDQAKTRLDRERQSVEQGLSRLDQLIIQRTAELKRALGELERSRALLARNAISREQFEVIDTAQQVALSLLEQARSERASLAALGAMQAERELTLREQELANCFYALQIKKLGARPEELAAAEARIARVRAEIQHLERLEQKQSVSCPTAGVVITPRVREQVGRFVPEGQLICEVQDRTAFEAEIRLAEQDAARIEPGRRIGVKLRALPYETFTATVMRIAPAATAAAEGESQSRVPVYCRLEEPRGVIRSQMTGYARIYCERRSLAEIGFDRLVRLVRTEFWW